MISDQQRLEMREQRTLLLSLLATMYPGSRDTESLFRSMLGAFPDYDQRLYVKDLYYLEEKGYLTRLNPVTHQSDGRVPYREARWRATAVGTEIAYRLSEDPAMEV